MYPHKLIGKLAIRTAPTSYGDHSYTDTPIRIMAVTESHIVYQYTKLDREILGGSNRILDKRWIDNNWTSYDDLMSLATEEHIEIMKSF